MAKTVDCSLPSGDCVIEIWRYFPKGTTDPCGEKVDLEKPVYYGGHFQMKGANFPVSYLYVTDDLESARKVDQKEAEYFCRSVTYKAKVVKCNVNKLGKESKEQCKLT